MPRRTSRSSALSTDMPNTSSKALRRATNVSMADSIVVGASLIPMGRNSRAGSWGMCSATRSLRPMEALVASHQIQSQKCVLMAGSVPRLGSSGGRGSCERLRKRYSIFVGPLRRTW
jgi:hypothetical protein